jgi:uncharacterized protein
MPQEEQLEALRTEHQHLEDQIDEEMQRPIPDTIRIQEMKRQKLRIKDEIAKRSSVDAG